MTAPNDSTAPTPAAFDWPRKACPCGDVMSAECIKGDCAWQRNPSLVPEHLRRPRVEVHQPAPAVLLGLLQGPPVQPTPAMQSLMALPDFPSPEVLSQTAADVLRQADEARILGNIDNPFNACMHKGICQRQGAQLRTLMDAFVVNGLRQFPTRSRDELYAEGRRIIDAVPPGTPSQLPARLLRPDEVDAVLAREPDNLADALCRAFAMVNGIHLAEPEGEAAAATEGAPAADERVILTAYAAQDQWPWMYLSWAKQQWPDREPPAKAQIGWQACVEVAGVTNTVVLQNTEFTELVMDWNRRLPVPLIGIDGEDAVAREAVRLLSRGRPGTSAPNANGHLTLQAVTRATTDLGHDRFTAWAQGIWPDQTPPDAAWLGWKACAEQVEQDDALFAMAFGQQLLDWNRAQVQPPIQVAYEAAVANAILMLLRPDGRYTQAELDEAAREGEAIAAALRSE